MFKVHLNIHCNICLSKLREGNQLEATECFIALIICSTCFGHLYAHHQELETVLVLWCVIFWLLVVGGQKQGSRLCVRDEGNCASLELLMMGI